LAVGKKPPQESLRFGEIIAFKLKPSISDRHALASGKLSFSRAKARDPRFVRTQALVKRGCSTWWGILIEESNFGKGGRDTPSIGKAGSPKFED
jgi:hypothetical protein